MYKRVLLVIILTILISGCQYAPSVLDEAATMVAETVAARPATITPIPTFTLPAATPIPLATAKPMIALTSTVEAASILYEMDVIVGEYPNIPYHDGYLGWRQVDPITISMSGPQQDRGLFQLIDEEITPNNFIFKSKVTWQSSGVLVCGLTFHAKPDLEKGEQYQFYFYRVSELPAYKIDVYEYGQFDKSISGIKYSDSMNEDTNEFILAVQDEEFTVYINGKEQGKFYDWSIQNDGGVIAFLAWQDSGKGTCTFEDSWLWILP